MENTKEITVYSSDLCVHCANLKLWLKNNKFRFNDKNVDHPKFSKELQEKGIQAVPYTIIKNLHTEETEYIIGFDESKLKNILLKYKS